ncbi:hypothetical protein DMP14_20785 [Pseudonocardia sp. Ae707_Ps2]
MIATPKSTIPIFSMPLTAYPLRFFEPVMINPTPMSPAPAAENEQHGFHCGDDGVCVLPEFAGQLAGARVRNERYRRWRLQGVEVKELRTESVKHGKTLRGVAGAAA